MLVCCKQISSDFLFCRSSVSRAVGADIDIANKMSAIIHADRPVSALPEVEPTENVQDALLAAVPTLAVPDLSVPDITIPEIAIPEIAMPEIAIPEIAVPEIAIPDLAVSEDAIPDLPTVSEPEVAFQNLSAPELSIPELVPPDFENAENEVVSVVEALPSIEDAFDGVVPKLAS